MKMQSTSIAHDVDPSYPPGYKVPRNSIDPVETNETCEKPSRISGTHFDPAGGSQIDQEENDDPSNLSHWLETLSEIYMNNLDNRARWDPRWLNVTRRARYEDLQAASVTILDYLDDTDTPHEHSIQKKKHLAAVLAARPETCRMRVIVVTDLSRFVMGALGQQLKIDPEFWFEHLVQSGYAASDIQLKVSNAVWMNWAEQETRFRHRALPGTGQRTEWNSPRRSKGRSWAHMRWGRLGLMHYLGKKGFHEDEIERRIGDGRWICERDVALDKNGLLLTDKRRARQKASQKREKEKREKKMAKKNKLQVPEVEEEEKPLRVKAANIYRAYSTFEGIPKNVFSWSNRDLRVLSPEGAGYWSGVDQNGKNTGMSPRWGRDRCQLTVFAVVLVLDPMRYMRDKTTKQLTPSLTFMPRPMEIESYSEEEQWRMADAAETYLDPPPPPITKAELKNQKREAKRQYWKSKGQKWGRKFSSKSKDDAELADKDAESEATVSEYSSDGELDEDYQYMLREEYSDPKPYKRDRDFARKYSLATNELVCRYLRRLTAEEVATKKEFASSVLCHIALDDLWQLLAEIRRELDHVDSDLSAGLYEQLVESIGNSTRQNITWIRCTLQELLEWATHTRNASSILAAGPDLEEEMNDVVSNIQGLQARSEQTLTLFASCMALAQSTMVIDQTSGINKLTELAFFFIPISFITSVFSMQVTELVSSPPRIWIWGVTLAAVALATYFVRSMLRSPTARSYMMQSRATIINRFSKQGPGSASQRFNTLGNRAILKYLVYMTSLILLTVIALTIFFAWAIIVILTGPAAFGVALYFIVIRWPDPAVLAPCFVSLPLSVLFVWTTQFWAAESFDWLAMQLIYYAQCVEGWYPAHWQTDAVDDADLAKEGVNTYARQALLLFT